MSIIPIKSTITGYLAGKQGEPRVKLRKFEARGDSPEREYCQITVSVKINDKKWFVGCQLPAYEYQRLLRVGEHSRVTVEGSQRLTEKDGRVFLDMNYCTFLGEVTADVKEDSGEVEEKKPAKAGRKKAAPAPDPVDEDDDDTEF